MTTKLSFEEFYEKLTAHEIWFDQIKMRFYRRNLQDVARECYLFLLASGNRWAAQDYEDFRRCYLNFLKNAKDQQQGPQLQQEQKKEVVNSEPILTGKERQARINEWLDEVNKSPLMKRTARLSHKQIMEEGDWLPKKDGVNYPSCSESEVKKRLLHLEYLKQNYDPRTQDPMPNWIEEDEWVSKLTHEDVENIVKANIKI